MIVFDEKTRSLLGEYTTAIHTTIPKKTAPKSYAIFCYENSEFFFTFSLNKSLDIIQLYQLYIVIIYSIYREIFAIIIVILVSVSYIYFGNFI